MCVCVSLLKYVHTAVCMCVWLHLTVVLPLPKPLLVGTKTVNGPLEVRGQVRTDPERVKRVKHTHTQTHTHTHTHTHTPNICLNMCPPVPTHTVESHQIGRWHWSAGLSTARWVVSSALGAYSVCYHSRLSRYQCNPLYSYT